MNRDVLRPGVEPREVWAWAAFDFANSGYTTVVLTAVFNAYFVMTVCGGAENATFMWTCIIAASNALSMGAMPVIGALTDAQASKKPWLLAMTVLCIAATVGLAFTGPGTVLMAGVLVILSNFAYNVGETLNSAFLPEIAAREAVGKVSGWGWSFGYCGGLVTLGGCLLLVTKGETLGLTADQCFSGTMWITALVFALAAAPLFLFLKERSRPRKAETLAISEAAMESVKDIRKTLGSLRDFVDFAALSLCGFCYQCGVSVVITLSAVYAAAVMGFEAEDTLFMVFIVNITAAAGAFLFGYVEDRIGHKRALAFTLFTWLAMILVALFSVERWQFWIAANLAGLAMGSSQSAGRAMVAVLAPGRRLAEFYSFWNMALWLAAIVGPLSYGAITWATGNNHRLAIAATGVFFVLAIVALLPVNLERGRAAAKRAEAADEADQADEAAG